VRRAALLFVVVFGLLVFTGIVTINSLSVVERVTLVDHIRGTVEAKQPGETGFKPLSGEARILSGTVLKTGRDAGALLHWADGTRLEAGAETTLTVLRCQLNKRTSASLRLFKLDVGRILVHVIQALSASSKFEVRTPTATAGVRGTEFAVKVASDGSTEVLVYEGNVAVGSGGKSLGVGQGHAVSVNGTGSVTDTHQLGDADRSEWEKSEAAKG